MRFTTCALACTENVEIHECGTHQIFGSVGHVGAIGANLIASAENSSQIDCLWVANTLTLALT